jgi:hypothetical protein
MAAVSSCARGLSLNRFHYQFPARRNSFEEGIGHWLGNAQTLVVFFLALFVGQTDTANLAVGFEFFSETPRI